MTDDGLTRSEIINKFGEGLGTLLLDNGFSSISSLMDVTDEELLGIAGIGPKTVEEIRKVTSLRFEEVESDGVEVEAEVDTEDETTDEVEASEVADAVEIAEPESEEEEPAVAEEQPETAVEGTEGDGGTVVIEGLDGGDGLEPGYNVEPGELVEGEMRYESVETGDPGPPPDGYPPLDTPQEASIAVTNDPQELSLTVTDVPRYSVRVQRIMDSQAEVEAERVRQYEIEDKTATDAEEAKAEEKPDTVLENDPDAPRDPDVILGEEGPAPLAPANYPAETPGTVPEALELAEGAVEFSGGSPVMVDDDAPTETEDTANVPVDIDVPGSVAKEDDPVDRLVPENYPGEGEEKFEDPEKLEIEEQAKKAEQSTTEAPAEEVEVLIPVDSVESGNIENDKADEVISSNTETKESASE